MPENFSCNLKFYESDSFSDSSLHRIFDSENFRFPFSTKHNLTWGVHEVTQLERGALKGSMGSGVPPRPSNPDPV